MYIRTPRVSVCRVRRWIPSKQGRAFLRLGFLVLVHHSCQAGRVPVSRFRSVFHLRPCSVVAIVNICCVVVSELFVHNISSEVWATASLEVHSHLLCSRTCSEGHASFTFPQPCTSDSIACVWCKMTVSKMTVSKMKVSLFSVVCPSAVCGRQPSSPMQAQVHLLGWDGRRMSEAARASEDIDTLFYPPPRCGWWQHPTVVGRRSRSMNHLFPLGYRLPHGTSGSLIPLHAT